MNADNLPLRTVLGSIAVVLAGACVSFGDLLSPCILLAVVVVLANRTAAAIRCVVGLTPALATVALLVLVANALPTTAAGSTPGKDGTAAVLKEKVDAVWQASVAVSGLLPDGGHRELAGGAEGPGAVEGPDKPVGPAPQPTKQGEAQKPDTPQGKLIVTPPVNPGASREEVPPDVAPAPSQVQGQGSSLVATRAGTCAHLSMLLDESTPRTAPGGPPVDRPLLELAYVRNCLKTTSQAEERALPFALNRRIWAPWAAILLALFPLFALAFGRAVSKGDPDLFLRRSFARAAFRVGSEAFFSRTLLAAIVTVGWWFVLRVDDGSPSSLAAVMLHAEGYHTHGLLYPWPDTPSAVLTAGFIGWYVHLVGVAWRRYLRGDVVSRRIFALFLTRLVVVIGVAAALSFVPAEVALPAAFVVGIFPVSAIVFLASALEKLNIKVTRSELEPVTLLDLPGAAPLDVRRLEEEGVETMADLAAQEPDELAHALPSYGPIIYRWVDAARLATLLDLQYARLHGPASIDEYEAAYAQWRARARPHEDQPAAPDVANDWSKLGALLDPGKLKPLLDAFPQRTRGNRVLAEFHRAMEQCEDHAAVHHLRSLLTTACLRAEHVDDLAKIGWVNLHLGMRDIALPFGEDGASHALRSGPSTITKKGAIQGVLRAVDAALRGAGTGGLTRQELSLLGGKGCEACRSAFDDFAAGAAGRRGREATRRTEEATECVAQANARRSTAEVRVSRAAAWLDAARGSPGTSPDGTFAAANLNAAREALRDAEADFDKADCDVRAAEVELAAAKAELAAAEAEHAAAEAEHAAAEADRAAAESPVAHKNAPRDAR